MSLSLEVPSALADKKITAVRMGKLVALTGDQALVVLEEPRFSRLKGEHETSPMITLVRVTSRAIQKQIVVKRRSEVSGSLGVHSPFRASVTIEISALGANAASGSAAVF
jgi:hypothetical protein